MIMAHLEEAAEVVLRQIGETSPVCSMILGSGWNNAIEHATCVNRIPYSRIPHLGHPETPGHLGSLWVARHRSADVLVFGGRRHWYEGCGWEPIAIPVYITRRIGIPTILLTNSAGGIRKDLVPGTPMVVEDHINLMGSNPLMGQHDPFWGPRFPDQTGTYSRRLQTLMQRAAQESRIAVGQGVYAAVSGPSYETPAEVNALRALGADAVGMSNVPEALLAHACGLEVAALCCISNVAAAPDAATLDHAHILDRMQRVLPDFMRLLDSFVRLLASDRSSSAGSRNP